MQQMRTNKAITSKQGKSYEKEVSLQVMVPARIKRAVSIKAAQEGTTQRTVILTGLKSIGIAVNEKELYDKRKLR